MMLGWREWMGVFGCFWVILGCGVWCVVCGLWFVVCGGLCGGMLLGWFAVGKFRVVGWGWKGPSVRNLLLSVVGSFLRVTGWWFVGVRKRVLTCQDPSLFLVILPLQR